MANFTEGGVSSQRNLCFQRIDKSLKNHSYNFSYYIVGMIVFRKEILARLKPTWFTRYRKQQILQRLYKNYNNIRSDLNLVISVVFI